MKSIPFALTALAVIAAVALALAQTSPGGSGNPTPPGRPPGAGQGRGGFAPPPFPGDSTVAERDSLMKEVLKSIAGKEQMPAESVFKDIQIFKGRPAGSIPQLMNYGVGRSLGVSCYHCHARNDWAKDEKKQKRIARDMFKMVKAINDDHLSKIEGLRDSVQSAGGPGGPDRRPVVNCGTCHRGSIHTNPDFGRGGGRPGGR